MSKLIGRPPDHLELDCEELVGLRGIYEAMRRNIDYQADHPNFLPADEAFIRFAAMKQFYLKRRRKH